MSTRCSSRCVTVEAANNESIECHSFKKSTLRSLVCYFIAILSAGFLFLVFYWKEDWKLKCMCSRCTLEEAEFVLIKDIYKRNHVAAIRCKSIGHKSICSRETLLSILKKDFVDADGNLRFFKFHKIVFIWDPDQNTILRLRGLEKDTQCSTFFGDYVDGLTVSQSEQRRDIYGENDINVRVRSIPVLLVQEVLNPFYIFQIFSVSVWIADEYYYYSACILIMSALSIAVSLYTTRTQSISLRNMVESNTKVKVLRPHNNIVEESEKNLVPGDVIIIPHNGCMVTYDAVLIAGNCIVDESSLTGESVPVTKTLLPCHNGDMTVYSPMEHKRHSLFCGTKVIQTRHGDTDEVKAVVVQTGFSTAKGALVQAILYPKPVEFKLHRDAIRFVGLLAFIAFLGLLYTIAMMHFKGATVARIIIRGLDIITIAVPPALPAALTIGMVYAQIRLKSQQIFCISPQRINLGGSLDVCCFDKTGTLTEDGLDLLGVQMVQDGRFVPLITSVTSLPIGLFISTMATCHSLAVVNEELTGDPLDMKMFKATEWSFHEPGGSSVNMFTTVKPPKYLTEADQSNMKQGDYRISILREFPFSSALQRMSVITQTEGCDNKIAYIKGSPEMIASLSWHATVPADFQQILSEYTRDGYRVLALAWKELKSDVTLDEIAKIQRKTVEMDLNFLGLMVMQNQLKPESKPVIDELNKANIRTVMITGDNVLTAINVARKCGMCTPNDKIIHVQVEILEQCDCSEPILTYTTVANDYIQTDEETNLALMSEKLNEETDALVIGKARPGRTHYALDGATFSVIQQHHQHLLEKVVVKGTIFARFSPNQKMQLVEELQHLDYFVGMCGDGANDCGALKTAHAGISLSEAEASVASPFTSKIPNISCVPIVIREGRAALVTSFGMFKYIALYSMIQFTTVMIIYSITSTMSDFQFYYIDMVLCTVTIILVSRGEAYHKISLEKPLTKLMTSPVIFSIVIQIVIVVLIQTTAFMLLKLMPWFVPHIIVSDEKNVLCSETTTLFLMSCYQYIIMGVVYTPRRPFRRPLYTLRLYSLSLIIMFVGTTLLLYVPTDKTLEIMQMVILPDYIFKTTILCLAILNFVFACIIEYLLVPNRSLMRFVSCSAWWKPKPPKYTLLEMDYSIYADDDRV